MPGMAGPSTGQPGEGDTGQVGCGLTSLGGCVSNAITVFFRGLVAAALNPLLELLSKTLLTTPTPESLPRIGELWSNSWQILLASYAVLILVAGMVVMAYQSLQTHYSIKEIAPRVVVGFLAGAMSLGMASTAIEIANALAQAVLGEGLDAASTGETLGNLVLGSVNGGIFVLLVGVFVAGMLLVLLVTYLVRVALTVVLVAGAPLALMFHALPQTEGIARWWWKAFGGCLAIQVVQSLTLITAMKVFLSPGGFTPFGPTTSGLVNLLVGTGPVLHPDQDPVLDPRLAAHRRWTSLRGGHGRPRLRHRQSAGLDPGRTEREHRRPGVPRHGRPPPGSRGW